MIEKIADEHGLSIERENIDRLSELLVEEGDDLMNESVAEKFVEDKVMEGMHLRDILDWKVDSFVKWDGNPGTGADAHAYFDTVDEISIDGIIEEHDITWYCGNGRFGYEVTNKRDIDGNEVLTLREA